MLPETNTRVRVLGLRNGRFVEFAFSLNDDDLMVELIMPVPAFEEFCRRCGATVSDRHLLAPVPVPGEAAADRGAGLYHGAGVGAGADNGPADPR